MSDQNTGFSRFFLYGEPAKPAGDRFVHLENLDDRTRPAKWVIRPHAHADLHHVFLIETGGGAGEAEGRTLCIAAPCVVIVPAGVVHGFRWREDAAGHVLTFSDGFLRRLAADEPALSEAFAHGMWSAAVESDVIAQGFARLGRELGWAAAGHNLAVAAHLSAILVETLRLNQQCTAEAHAPPGPHALLVARYRELIEAHFREHPSVAWSAARLRVTPSRLRTACRVVAGISPIRMLQDRLRLEGGRVMRYSNMSVAQVAAYLGFRDPAYFSRFFARECGASPRAFRSEARGAGSGASAAVVSAP